MDNVGSAAQVCGSDLVIKIGGRLIAEMPMWIVSDSPLDRNNPGREAVVQLRPCGKIAIHGMRDPVIINIVKIDGVKCKASEKRTIGAQNHVVGCELQPRHNFLHRTGVTSRSLRGRLQHRSPRP